MNQALIDFFHGTGIDDRGRTLADILRQDDDWLEATHDFVQWLFPLGEPSGVNPHAPLLDQATIHAIRADASSRRHLRTAFLRMLRFYGLDYDGAVVTRSAQWAQRKAVWFTRHTHNDLRITRILKSLRLLGLPDEARAFHAALIQLCASERDCGVTHATRQFWLGAMGADTGD